MDLANRSARPLDAASGKTLTENVYLPWAKIYVQLTLEKAALKRLAFWDTIVPLVILQILGAILDATIHRNAKRT